MKVLHINSVYGHSSTGRIVASIHHELMNTGDDSFVLYGRESAIGKKGIDNIDKNTLLIENKFGMYKHLSLGVLFDKHGLYSKKETLKFIEKIKEFNPDIIHLHNIHGFYLNYEMLFKFLKVYDKPIVWTLHDCWSFTGFCSHFEFNNCDKWKSGCKKCQYRNVYPYRIFSRSAKNYNLKKSLFNDLKLTIVTPSYWLKKEIESSFLKNNIIKVINNSIDLNQFKYAYDQNLRKEYQLEEKQILLAVSSIWNKQKGFDEYLQLAKLLDDNQVIVMIGVNDKQIEILPNNIIGIARTNSIDELNKWYSISDVLINLTLEDTYPTVNLEAMACGLPVITYDTGGSSEMVEANYVVSKYDLNGIINKIKTVDLSRKVIVNKDNMISEYIKLYKELL